MSLSISFIGRALMVLAALAFLFVAPLAFAHERKGSDDKPKAAKALAVVRAARPSVAIGEGGQVHLHKAKVTAVSGSTLTVSTAWGAANLTWSVVTNASTTRFSAEGAGKTTLATIAVGDVVSVEGKLATSSAALTVEAKAVKEKKQ